MVHIVYCFSLCSLLFKCCCKTSRSSLSLPPELSQNPPPTPLSNHDVYIFSLQIPSVFKRTGSNFSLLSFTTSLFSSIATTMHFIFMSVFTSALPFYFCISEDHGCVTGETHILCYHNNIIHCNLSSAVV